MHYKLLLQVMLFSIAGYIAGAQNTQQPAKGNLFIIGGGNRSPALLQKLMETAKLGKTDHVVVLPMSSAEADSSFYYFKIQLEKVCTNTIANLNFTADKINNRQWLDSLQNAKLIFITGGDQVRFMKAVWHTPVYNAIHYAYEHGATIAGTSAGAAVMPVNMMTGNALLGDTAYHETFNKLVDKNIEFKEGLGLVDSVIIDQHFLARSRHNRLISALAKFPAYTCIGINESTAIIIHGKKAEVAGISQVIVMSDPLGLTITSTGLIKFTNARFSIYTAGDIFDIK